MPIAASRLPAGSKRRLNSYSESCRPPSPPPRWKQLKLRAWAFVFAGMSFYWASGGTAGGDTIGPAITKPVAAGAPGWIALLWDPWWLMGGILLGIAAWGYQRRSCLFA